MRIIGVDPGTVCCGYGIVDSRVTARRDPAYVTSGEIRMSPKAPLPERLKSLHDSLKSVIDEHKPSHLCVEKIFYHKSIRSALALGSSRGVILLLAAESSLPVFEYNSTELKMALTGYGRAEKRQVQQMVKILLNLDSSNLSEDSTDALALCICHINSSLRLK